MPVTGVPLFPVTVIGSWPRPPWLVDALRKRQAGQLTRAEFNAIADRAVLEALIYQDGAGVDIVSDRAGFDQILRAWMPRLRASGPR